MLGQLPYQSPFQWPSPAAVQPTTAAVPPMAPQFGSMQELAERAGALGPQSGPIEDSRQTDIERPPRFPILSAVAENVRSGPISGRIDENRNALLGIAAGLSTPSGGVMGPNMGAVAANLAGGMQADDQRSQQMQADQALTALLQSPEFAELPESYRNLLMADPELGRAVALEQMMASTQGGQAPTDDIQEYQYAVQNGFAGSFADWMEIRAPGTTISIPQIGSIPQGYRVIYDDNGNPVSMEPVPGGPAAAELAEGEEAAEQARQNELTTANIVVEDIDRALDGAGAWTTGLLGQLTAGIPGTPAYDLARLVDTIRANVGFARLQAMRDASPTGGALGQVSEMENRLLQSVLGNLEASQSESQFRENLARLKDVYLDTIHGAGNWSIDGRGEVVLRAAQQDGTQGAPTLRYDPATDTLVPTNGAQ